MQTDAFLMKQSRILVSLGPLRLINGTTQLGRNGGCWCEQREVDLLQAPVSEVVNFCHNDILKAKATLQSTLIGQLFLHPCTRSTMMLLVNLHPLVARLLKKNTTSEVHFHVIRQLGMLLRLPVN